MSQLIYNLSLERLALLKIAVQLWTQPDILEELFASYLKPLENGEWDKWLAVRNKLRSASNCFQVSRSLLNRLGNFIDQTGIQIRSLAAYYKKLFSCDVNMIEIIPLIHWNLGGGIDKKKTATAIIKKEGFLTAENHFILACENCLVEYVITTWKESSHSSRMLFLELLDRRLIPTYWSLYVEGLLEGPEKTLRSYNIKGCYLLWSIMKENFAAFEYFWEKLTEGEQYENIVSYALKAIRPSNNLYNFYRRDIFQFLVSQMDVSQIKKMMSEFGFKIAIFWFCDGIWQDSFFYFKLEYFWNFTSDKDYFKFLVTISHFERTWFPSKYSRKCNMMFGEFWENAPYHVKRYFFENKQKIGILLLPHVQLLDTSIMEMIFNDATTTEKQMIINNSKFFYNQWIGDLTMKLSVLHNFFAITTTDKEDDFFRDLKEAFYAERSDEEKWHVLDVIKKWHFIRRFENDSLLKPYDIFAEIGANICSPLVKDLLQGPISYSFEQNH